MATPSSSATSPSPPMTYLAHSSGHSQLPQSAFIDPVEKEHRQRAIQKFMARAEISTITRALRTRLSYASYKAAHNIHHVPLRDLEAQSQSQSQSASFSRTIAAKRKAAGNNNYYNNPATQGPLGMSAGSSSLRRGGSGSMLPPSTTSSPRTYYPAVNGSAYATTSNNDPGSISRTGNSKQSLYTSILAPPPTKQARTIHNAGDPPVAASSRPLASPRARAPKPVSRSTAEATSSHAKGRKLDHSSSPRSPNTRKAKRTQTDKGKQKQKHNPDVSMDVDGDVDMKAAATLTSLLLHHRPSITGSASSPRSSIDGSEAGSVYSHFAQSSARTIAAPSPPGPASAAASTSTVTESSFRNQTPPPAAAAGPENSTTPRPAPTDNEAANLMLYLATSPSPARPTNKDSRDLAAYRALGGGPPGVLRDTGRVLFASSSSPDTASFRPHALSRGGDTSFTSSISSIGTDVGGGNVMDTTRTISAPSQLLPPHSLPPHSLPSQKSASGSPPGRKEANESPRPIYVQAPVEFNFSDFIHGSPSPSRGPIVPAPKANLGLRADVGRKLFEEEQMRHALSGAQSPGKRREERPLGAGIDLVQS
ncbi:hypothetical protein D9615_010107 [Tricholomella constricta]|uniref:Uncharacterized protein n=1 Tax=Tricholomella constricta TaxID=117010 RepID=A0A8H5GXC7_9AGAR|nr:hypothetical protein D9615_010107 [Tricholomella constricta]